MQYGIGYGTSKKQAKSEAARLTLEILIPDLREKLVNDAKGDGASGGKDQGLSVMINKITVCPKNNLFAR